MIKCVAGAMWLAWIHEDVAALLSMALHNDLEQDNMLMQSVGLLGRVDADVDAAEDLVEGVLYPVEFFVLCKE